MDIYPFATTSPIYVLMGGKPIASAKHAAYFIAWIDRLEEGARAHRDWNSDAERDAVLGDLSRARERFRELVASRGR